jgi:translation initiation factor IF-3
MLYYGPDLSPFVAVRFSVVYWRYGRSAPIRDRFRINNRIRAPQVRLIDENGGQLGIVGLREALTIAEERGLDLMEVAPNAVPPVCRIVDYGKFRYEQSKKDREARKHQKQAELKEVRLKPKTDEHDLEVKAKQARRFLLDGHKVKFTVRFRGREIFHPDIGREMLLQMAEDLRDTATVEQQPLMEGRALSIMLAPSAKAKAQREKQLAQEARRDQAARTEQEPAPVEPDDDIDDDDDDTDDEEV